jgi:hypothetical protein
MVKNGEQEAISKFKVIALNESLFSKNTVPCMCSEMKELSYRY